MDRREFCKAGFAGIGALALSGNLQAMERSANNSGKKQWAILYGSQCGSTKEYAGYINEGLGGVAEVVDIAKAAPAVNDYEHFIIGGWRSGNGVMPAAIPNFIKNNKAALKDKIKGLFIVLGNNGNATLSSSLTQFLNDKLVTPTGVSNIPARVLFGKSDPQCNGFSMSYNNVSKNAGVDFGQSILSTHTQRNRSGFSNTAFELFQNYPNPFKQVTSIRYYLPEKSDVELSIKTLSGRELTRLVSGKQECGSHKVAWNARGLAPGYYLYQLKTGRFTITRTAAVVML
ncbi:MAG TPA: flavodoxin domain-containing protein [Chitinispirillaceae bacterium]|nr:flavodoxin domain-containing protein [Chitinispirillaceae bacterium]